MRDYVAKAFPSRKRAPVWGQALESRAKSFCEAETKSAKVDWLTREGVPQAQAVAQSTTLEDGVGSYRRDFWRSLNLGNLAPYTKKDGEDAGKLADEMESLANRMGKNEATKAERDVLERYLRELVKGPAAGLPERLAPVLGRTGLVPPTDASLRATQRLRFVDRGLAAREPMPLSLLTEENADIGTLAAAQPRDWRAMFVVPKLQSPEEPYILHRSDGGLVAFAVLVHAPYEVLRIDIQRSEKRPTITAVEILALH